MFTKILIANRGAIACRIIRTLRSMGIGSVAIYSEADIESLHVSQADEAFCLPGTLASETYLNSEAIISIAKNAGVQAIHPGYGFLSENVSFARQCEEAGIAFIGPAPEHIEQFGLKHTARELAEKSQVPLVPGSDLIQSLDDALEQGCKITYPLMLKSTAGGGGIGMQVCESELELSQAFEKVKRLSQNNFGNDNVFLEKYIGNARHIEIQVLGDGEGNVVALGERDCSLQRRNQKVIEETPAPNLSEVLRNEMMENAVALAKSVNYRSAGTVEYIFDCESEQYYFLEMNTRLQVEHGVTELITGVDLVQCMIEIAAGKNQCVLEYQHKPQGHAIQARVYAEDPGNNFQPSSGTITHVSFSTLTRNDHFIEAGVCASPFYDPMLGKVIAYADNREQALSKLSTALKETSIEGIVTNIDYLYDILQQKAVVEEQFTTRFLNQLEFRGYGIEILEPGTQTTVQDYPGRTGYWDIGVPPSGAMDNLALQIGNKILGNEQEAAALEITLNGPTLKFRCNAVVVLTGANMVATLDDISVPFWQALEIRAGSVLAISELSDSGMRCYLCVKGGIKLSDYLGSKSTFTLGQFGGYGGRALLAGDVLPIEQHRLANQENITHVGVVPRYQNHWNVSVIYGPHGAPDFFTPEDIETFFAAKWEVHFNSSRTGVRLIGPKPEWARDDGGEAGLHPSNIHDNAYAIGAIDFTGDMPVILGPDGPSLGGFVCPVTIIKADLWKVGQLKPGDTITFAPVTYEHAVAQEKHLIAQIQSLDFSAPLKIIQQAIEEANPIVKSIAASESDANIRPAVHYRVSGDDNVLIEYGPLELDLALRFRVHALMLLLQEQNIKGVLELTPGIRSLQVHYNNLILSQADLLEALETAEHQLGDVMNMRVPTRTVYLPLSWDDPATKLAIEKYMTTVNPDAPWCPSNIEFIRRINGLESIDDVKRIVFDASYLVMGLGDVYLGAPVATPLDPRHRLVTTKYNPARTWTPENAVGIGGAYLCVYGMEGPGGYQFVGRTVQMWNRYRQTTEFNQPWLLRFFDQIKFYEVTQDELQTMRRDFPLGRCKLRIEESEFSLADYLEFLKDNAESIDGFQQQQRLAFAQERERWQSMGLRLDEIQEEVAVKSDVDLDIGQRGVYAKVPGSVWQLQVKEGALLQEGENVAVIESMKMEFPLASTTSGQVMKVLVKEGQQIRAGQMLMIVE